MLAISEPTIRAVAGRSPVLVQNVDPKAAPFVYGLALQLEKNGIRVMAPPSEQTRFGQRRVGHAVEGSLGLLVASGDNLENLRHEAQENVSHPAGVRLVAAYGEHPQTSIAVFSYLVD
jgi:hypothetical protein